MASNEEWLKELSARTGASVEQSDLDRLNSTNPDDLDRLMGALESQYERRGDSQTTGSGMDSTEATAAGYGSARDETADDRYNAPGFQTGDGGGSSGGSGVSTSWSGGGGAEYPDWYRQLVEQQFAQQQQQQAENKARSDALYETLAQRAGQSLEIDRFDPIIRAQADAFAANQERARRNYLSDTAEAAGPYANIQGERRMAAERYGATTGAFEAELMGRELMARRAEIAQALQGQMGMLSGDQVRELQRQLSLMDQAIQEQQVIMGFRGQDLGYDQFLRDLALRDWDRRQYYSPTNPWIYA